MQGQWTGSKLRGPIPKDVSVIKDDSPYAPGRVPALFFPARYEKSLIETPGTRVQDLRTGAHTHRPRHKAPESIQNGTSSRSAAGREHEFHQTSDGMDLRHTPGMADGAKNTNGRDHFPVHVGLSRTLHLSPGPDFNTYERAKRCAIHTSTHEQWQSSSPKPDVDADSPRKLAAAANIKARVIETRRLGHAKETYRLVQNKVPPKKDGSQTHRPMLETSHLFPRESSEEYRTNIGRLQDSVNLLLQRIRARDHRQQREERYTYYWDALHKDDEYLMKTTLTQDFKGRRALNQAPGEAARYKASQIQYLWRRSALMKEVKEARDEEERLVQTKRIARIAAKKKREEELAAARKDERKRAVIRVGNIVFKALCTDPHTGNATDPKSVFRRLDVDKSGTVDMVEFRKGLEYCHCFLADEDLSIIWDEIDQADGGERDGQVDYAVLVAKLQTVNDVALRQLRPREREQLQRNSVDALEAVRRKVGNAEREQAWGSAARAPGT